MGLFLIGVFVIFGVNIADLQQENKELRQQIEQQAE